PSPVGITAAKRARAVVREANGGFSKTCNTGIAAAKWKILILPQFRR
ncbi:MAG: hypothetical protein IIC13_13295, partial [SAR324 cluster bacterium]|nr:hypothetical protein [SAR324 cluster bacterium]